MVAGNVFIIIVHDGGVKGQRDKRAEMDVAEWEANKQS